MPQPSPALSWNAVATLTSLPFPRFWKPLPLGPAGWWYMGTMGCPAAPLLPHSLPPVGASTVSGDPCAGSACCP